jgi:hypothetical protein
MKRKLATYAVLATQLGGCGYGSAYLRPVPSIISRAIEV